MAARLPPAEPPICPSVCNCSISSTRNRLVSDRPLGAFLSGGIDSSLTCALAAPHVSGALKTFTMGWDDHEYDESDQAALVASALGAEHHEIRLSRDDVVHEARRLAAVMDEPFADSSQLAVQLVAAAAREKVVVAISGDGGDELFGGYNRHRWLLKVSTMQARLPGWSRRSVAALTRHAAPTAEWVTRPLPHTRRPRLVGDKMRKFADALGSDTVAESYQQVIAQNAAVRDRAATHRTDRRRSHFCRSRSPSLGAPRCRSRRLHVRRRAHEG